MHYFQTSNSPVGRSYRPHTPGGERGQKIRACDLNIENTKCFCLDAALNTHFLLEKPKTNSCLVFYTNFRFISPRADWCDFFSLVYNLYLRRGKKYRFRDCSERGRKKKPYSQINWLWKKKGALVLSVWAGEIVEASSTVRLWRRLVADCPLLTQRSRGRERATASCCFFYSFQVASLDSVRTARSNDRR